MSIDGITLHALQQEIQEELIGGKITRIFQPERLLITLEVRRDGCNHWLLLSAHPAYPRLHLTSLPYQNPTQAPDFCMLLRKHIQYSTLSHITQLGMDRILDIHLQGRDEKPRSLVVEIMGRHSNIILVQEGIIKGSIKNITSKVSRYRQVLPGLPYVKPPAQKKEDPETVEAQKVCQLFQGEKQAFRILLHHLEGLGPLLAQEMLLRSGIHPPKKGEEVTLEEKKAFQQVFSAFQQDLKRGNFSPSALLDEEGQITAFSALSLSQSPSLTRKDFSSLAELLDFYAVEKIQKEKLLGLQKSLSSTVDSFYRKGKKRLKTLKEDLKKGEKAYQYKEKGDLITANIYQLKKGLQEISLPKMEDPAEQITIQLNPALKPSENAQKYYQRYQKLKKSCHHLKKEQRKMENELKYLSQVQMSIEEARNEEELLVIKEELQEEGYLKKNRKRGSAKKQKTTPLTFRSSENYQIFVGRNNKENDYLTMNLAGREDIWLHVKDLAGSHVIIKRHNRDPVPEKTLEEAAILAACYSRGHLSSKVPVDYTLVKHVQKPKEARPGMVYYQEYQTIQVAPDKQILEKLKKEV